jgi:hypothetical protein
MTHCGIGSRQPHGEGGPETGTLEHPVPRSEMGLSLLQVGPFDSVGASFGSRLGVHIWTRTPIWPLELIFPRIISVHHSSYKDLQNRLPLFCVREILSARTF